MMISNASIFNEELRNIVIFNGRSLSSDALSSFNTAKSWITYTFTWLYVGSQDIWALLMIAIYFSKYGALKLGT